MTTYRHAAVWLGLHVDHLTLADLAELAELFGPADLDLFIDHARARFAALERVAAARRRLLDRAALAVAGGEDVGELELTPGGVDALRMLILKTAHEHARALGTLVGATADA